MITPLDAILWALAALIATAALVFMIAIVVSLFRFLRKPRPESTDVFKGGAGRDR